MPDSPSTKPDSGGIAAEPDDAPGRVAPTADRLVGGTEPGRPGTSSPARGETAPPTAFPARFRWTCPVCDEIRLTLVTEERCEAHVANDLRSHVREASGGGHGPRGEVPRRVDSVDLRRHVGRTDE